MKKAILLISLLVAVCATTTPVQKRPDGSITINTSTLKAAEGYFGPTPIVIHLDSHERVSGIEFLPNNETPSYWQMAVEKLSHAWDGVSADKVSTLKVDAVSGATYSSEGIISNVQAGIACYLESKGKRED